MFDSVVLRRSVDGPAITAGEVAEALLFYQNVHLVLDYSSLIGLVASIGMPTLLAMARRPDFSITYVEEITGTRTEQTAHGPRYKLAAITLMGDQATGVLKSKKKRLIHMLERRGYKLKHARRMAEQFAGLVRRKTLTSDYFVKGGVIKSARLDLADTDYVDLAARIEAKTMLHTESLPGDFYFRVSFVEEDFSIATNLDFDEAFRLQKAWDPKAERKNPAHVMTTILSASVGTILAGHYGTDFYTSDCEAQIISSRQKGLLIRTNIDREKLDGFKLIAIDDSPGIVEVINSGERSIEEFLELLKSASKFKGWLKGKSPDENLASAYLEEVTKKTWLNKISGKSLRYSVGAILGAIDPISGLALSAGDTFFLEKMLGGWRPNHFVNDSLRPFLNDEKEP